MSIKINLAQFCESERQYRRLKERIFALERMLDSWRRKLAPDTGPNRLILPRNPEWDQEVLDVVIALEERIKVLTAERDAVSIVVLGDDENESQ